ncbi:hypothetical protein [Natrinema sp. 1APR25-10V2]|uniref:hypothetical protein n=1 Tax=Natrinema sp. 1APR25-10V2 TaxID=2951081 RepID=UPI0028750A8A|nr:hypothetical protein [Natrinema sp. 1APR25-10V2]MDS0475766.1 hypothetical protein [Natrinema sp. 1APR25-10V2]
MTLGTTVSERGTRGRATVFFIVVVLLLPTGMSAAFHGPRPQSVSDDVATGEIAENLTVVAAQGDRVAAGGDSRLVVLETETKRAVWETTTYTSYFDVDPLNDSTLLYTGTVSNGTTYAVVHNWRTDEVYDRFEVAEGTHDIDYLGNGTYVYTDGREHRVVVYNRTSDRNEWVYDLTERFPPDVGGGAPSDYSGDFSHINDVDSVHNGSAFLISPRNFDRVLLINRSTKEVEWTLGEEDNYDVLYEQHNPVLLESSPPTVLVADSENDRIVEYRRTGEEWTMVWEFATGLSWPRDADRLPNGNTILVDSGYAMEVTPSRDIVWRVQVPKYLYDIERIHLGDEPQGPSMVEFRDEFQSASAPTDRSGIVSYPAHLFENLYSTAQWVLPWWLSAFDFATVGLAFVVLFVWGNAEIGRWLHRSRGSLWRRERIPEAFWSVLIGVALLTGAATLYRSVAPSIELGNSIAVKWWRWDPFYIAAVTVVALEAVTFTLRRDRLSRRVRTVTRWARTGFAVALLVLAVGMSALVAGLGSNNVHISNPEQLVAIGLAATVLGVRRLGATDPGEYVHKRLTPSIRTVIGLVAAAMGLAVLGLGMSALDQPGGFLGLGLLLLIVGDETSRNGVRETAAVRGEYGSVPFDVARYVLRLIGLLLAGGLFLRTLGLGTITGLSIGPELLNPMYVTLLVLLPLEAFGPLRPGAEDSERA